MKIRNGFVSNSSSSSFLITNTSDENKSLVDFVKENPMLVIEFKEEYDWYEDDPRFTFEKMLENAESRNLVFEPGSQIYAFGDEDGDTLGHVFDYILRGGGKSENFRWKFHEGLR